MVITSTLVLRVCVGEGQQRKDAWLHSYFLHIIKVCEVLGINCEDDDFVFLCASISFDIAITVTEILVL